VREVGADEAVLFFGCWVVGCVAEVRGGGVVVVIAPFGLLENISVFLVRGNIAMFIRVSM
jgi:hypothetical protein